MGPLANLSVGDLMYGMVFPGLIMAGLYLVYIFVLCTVWPKNIGPVVFQLRRAGSDLRMKAPLRVATSSAGGRTGGGATTEIGRGDGHLHLGCGTQLRGWIADIHGGSITVESEVNKGSTFTVTLPLKPQSSEK